MSALSVLSRRAKLQVRREVAVPGLLGEPDSIVGESGVDLIRHRLKHVLQGLPRRLSVSCCNELSDSELGCPIDANEQVELAFGRLHRGDVDMETRWGSA